jgi:hypothetical protein
VSTFRIPFAVFVERDCRGRGTISNDVEGVWVLGVEDKCRQDNFDTKNRSSEAVQVLIGWLCERPGGRRE